MAKIKLIVGSTRPHRFGVQPAHWLFEIAQKRTDAEFELVDLQEVGLPLLDEPVPPSQNKYSKEHTKKWSAIVDDADGFVFITPEYNHSFPAALKNAIDFVWHEWNYKAAAFVSYGGPAGGTRAIEHLRAVASEVKLFDIREQVTLHNYWTQLDETGKFKFTEQHVTAANALLDQIVFWSNQFKKARAELTVAAN